MTNEEQALKLAGLKETPDEEERYYNPFNCKIYDKCLEMAVLKEQQMIQLLREIEIEDGDIEDYGNENTTPNYGFSEKFIKRLKQSMEGE